jgi:hypothetical protein
VIESTSRSVAEMPDRRRGIREGEDVRSADDCDQLPDDSAEAFAML